MNNVEAIHKLKTMQNTWQKVIDAKVNLGRLVGTDATETWKVETSFDDACQNLIEAVTLAISALEKQEADRWIPVTERLPEKEGCYLVTVKNDHKRKYSKTAWYSGDGWFARQDIIAWRLTPEPYTEEEA